ncbi:MAG: hypothetical protein H2057_05410 [Alphaproteobacteria bacterium]|nr:hypothetical protein [Alphaproteobacteria bacterium]
MKHSSLSLVLILSVGTVNAGHFYNTSDINDLRDGVALNRSASMGLADSCQAALISPRLAVTAHHQSFGDKGENMGISFYGQNYRVIHSIDRPGLDVASGDLRLFVLDRDVVHPDGNAPCLPVAVQNVPIDANYGYPEGVIAHSLSHSPNIKLKNQGVHKNRSHSVLYGRTFVNYASNMRNDTDAPLPDGLDVRLSNTILDKDMMVPVVGDSGSPLYVSLQNGGHATWGVVSGVDDTDAYRHGCYTSLARNIGWLQAKEQNLIDRGILAPTVTRIQTVNQDEWVPQGQCLTLPPEFDPELYLSLNEDIRIEAQRHHNALSFASDHFMNYGRTERRQWCLPSFFVPEAYLAYNPDLEDASKNLAGNEKTLFLKNHFAKFGRHEERRFTFPDDFDPVSYLVLNPDVAKVSQTKPDPLAFAKEHFKSCGIRENRAYRDDRFNDFNPEIYLALNPDVAAVARTKQNPNAFALWHITTCGLQENRRCRTALPQDFNPQRYLEIHLDISLYLADHPELDVERFAREHYETNGSVLENRLYK